MWKSDASRESATLNSVCQTTAHLHTCTPVRSVELSKNKKAFVTGRKKHQYPDFVGLFHTSKPLRRRKLTENDKGLVTLGKV